MSAPRSYAARNTFRPIRPKPLIPTPNAMRSSPPLSVLAAKRRPTAIARRPFEAYLNGADHLDPQPVGIAHVCGVAALAVLRSRPRQTVVRAAVGETGSMRRVHRRLAAGTQRQVAIVRRRRSAADHDPDRGRVDAVRHRLFAGQDPPGPERIEDRVVEPGGPREIGDLKAHVIDHPLASLRSVDRHRGGWSRPGTPPRSRTG